MSTEASPPPAEGPLAVDQAVAALAARRTAPAEAVEQAAPEPVAAEPISEAEPTAEETAIEPEAANEGEQPAEPPEPETPAIEPPRFWDAEAKARFRELSAEHQAFVLSQSEKGVAASAKAIQEASERAKAAEEQARGVTALAKELSDFLPQALDTFKSRWEGVDWLKLANEAPDDYVRYKAMHDAEKDQLEQVSTANQKAQAEAHAAFVREQKTLLATVAPELADPKEGPKRRAELGSWLKSQGVSDEEIVSLPAVAASMAYDAMRYRLAKANAAKPTPKPQPVAAKPVPPTSSAANPQHRSVMDASSRLAKSGSVDDAVKLLQARRKG